ncbi:methylmalonyl-CoA mutase family protein [Marivirga arenosa]|uniref:Methylmalonyl-CoA mutase family protein n=1 Tax=Marivirga arenosa TaxID=3059076 RepID=A0AA49GFQ5_9BACT|nr:methylmalonyl-CoA mutase family protein [Marivirga sp. BKB1-2]WKK83247.2 methylmalonyl-CoA mutase family protein [Marivirga sp. BKB1-2]
MSRKKLFEDFGKSSAIDWKNQIIKELKDKPFESLVTKTVEGISIQPFYHQDNSDFNYLNIQNPIQNQHEALPPRFWVNQAKIVIEDEKSANQKALQVLNQGADGIIFKISKADYDLEILLKDIKAEYCSISFQSDEPFYSYIKKYINYINSHNIDSHKLSGFYLCDIIECRDAGNIGLNDKDYESIAELIKHADEYPNFKPLCISSNLFHNSGANITHELGLTLTKSVEFLDKLTDQDLKASSILKSTVFSIAVGKNYFFEIAKLKALKLNLLKIAEAYESKIDADDISIHCDTSIRTKSALDFNVNLLRNTNEAMAAIVGGCNSLWVQPHDEAAGKPSSETFKRIALNISSILKEESHLDKIVDPTQGSYYIENLINEIAENSWKIFLEFEEEGSYNHHYENGNIHQLIDTDAGKAEQKLWSRKDVVIGANTFQLIGENVSEYLDTEESGKSLEAKRLTATIEHMRYRIEKLVKEKGENSRPMAEIISLGTDPVTKAKADFAYSFLGIAGIGISSEKIEKELSQVKDSNEEVSISVLCYSDKPSDLNDYITNQNKIILIAGQEENEEQLKKLGLYGCINRNVDTKRFLDNLLKDLGIALI